MGLVSSQYSLAVTTTPASEPVTLAEVKTHLRIDNSDEDTYLTTLIKVARLQAEQRLRRSLINTTWAMKLDCFPSFEIEIPRAPLSSVTSIAYLDADGASQTLATSVYTVDTASEPGRIYLAYQQVWPITYTVPRAVTITFVAGYGATAASVPETIRQWLLLAIGDLYENRESVIVGTITTRLDRFDSLLSLESWESYP